MNIVLVGLPGTGKSRLGQRLARELRLDFVDTDDLVACSAGRPAAGDVLREEGERAFRARECDVLERVLAQPDTVVATGGGIVTTERARDLLTRSTSRVLALHTRLDRLTERCSIGDRPLLQGDVRSTLERLWQERVGHYRAVAEAWFATDRSPAVTVRDALAFVRLERLAANVYFGAGARQHAFRFHAGDAALVTHPELERLYGADLGRPVHGRTIVHRVAEGEGSKSLRVLDRLYRASARGGLGRDSSVVGVGGGVITDLAGHFAATYLRGVPFVSVPTTLLAQVDASIGGKCGVDLPEGKNLVGSFYPARAILLDPDVLTTLPAERVREGMAEVVKVGFALDAELYRMVADLGPAPYEDADLTAVMRQAARDKLQVVEQDPYEQGVRAVLNFGHTFGHAIEMAAKYTLSHGDSVAIGMVAALRLSERLLGFPHAASGIALLERMGLPTVAPVTASEFLPFLERDKKRRGGKIHMVLIEDIGHWRLMPVEAADLQWAAYTVALTP